jgi:hypothetical protein
MEDQEFVFQIVKNQIIIILTMILIPINLVIQLVEDVIEEVMNIILIVIHVLQVITLSFGEQVFVSNQEIITVLVLLKMIHM